MSDDNPPANDVELGDTVALAIDGTNLYVGTLTRVLKVDLEEGTLAPFAGTGDDGIAEEEGPASEIDLWAVSGLAVDAVGDVYIIELGTNSVRKVDADTGLLTTIAGTVNVIGDSGDGGPATVARFNWPSKVALDRHGHL